ANTNFKVFRKTSLRDNFTGLVNTRCGFVVADDSGSRIWFLHVFITGPSFQCWTHSRVPMFSRAFIKLFFPFVAAAVLIFIIASSSPTQFNVVLRVVSVDFACSAVLSTKVPKRSVSSETNEDAGRLRLDELM